MTKELEKYIRRIPRHMHVELDQVEDLSHLIYRCQVEIDLAESGSVDPAWSGMQFAMARQFVASLKTKEVR